MILKKGSRGEDVRRLQTELNRHGYGLIVDGAFGELTEEAVMDFQKKSKTLVVDGVVGDATWAALTAKKTIKKSKRTINLIVVHSTATREGKDYTVADIRRMHKANGWRDIGYHYVVYRDGSVHEGRSIDLAGAHARGHNANSIGVVYIGGVDKNGKAKDTRTDAQKASLRRLLTDLRVMYPKAKIVGHRNVNATACPSFDAKKEYSDI